MREIPSLHVLCLRAVGSQACSAEDTFAKVTGSDDNEKHPSTASRLIRSFHLRPTTTSSDRRRKKGRDSNNNSDDTLSCIPMPRKPCIGPGSARRLQANEVDLHHPFIGCRPTTLATADDAKVVAMPRNGVLIMEYGNTALDALQSYLDSLVELGRMDDGRVGLHFFEEWRANVLLAAGQPIVQEEEETTKTTTTPMKRRRSGGSNNGSSTKKGRKQQKQSSPKQPDIEEEVALGSLSFHNCTVSDQTFDGMMEANIGPNLAILDLSGVRGLTDDILDKLVPTCPNMRGLSLKNCRRITSNCLNSISKHLKRLERIDIGGAYNITTTCVLECVPKLTALVEMHGSGLGWTDHTISELVEIREHWEALSLSFSPQLTQSSLRQNLLVLASSLRSLSLAFCESVIDNAAMGLFGRNLPHVTSLDLRGNPQLSTITGWYDGRVSANLPAGQNLVVLGRYSGLSEASVEETKRIHPLEAVGLLVVLDGDGMGLGIQRTDDGKAAVSTDGDEAMDDEDEEE